MALSFMKWAATVIAGCVVAGVLVSRAPESPQPMPDARRRLDREATRAQSVAAREADRLRLVQLRDSLRAVPALAARSDSARWIVDSRLPAGMINPLEALRVRAQRFRPERAALPVDVVFVLDSAPTVRGTRRSMRDLVEVAYALPQASGDRCTVLVSVNPPHTAQPTFHQRGQFRAMSTDFFAHRLLGPCGFYEWFGTPGPGVDQWLRTGGWAFGLHAGAWERSALRWQPWNRWWYENSFGAEQSGWPLRYFVSPAAYRCLSGDANVCDRLALGQGGIVRPDSLNPVWNGAFVTPADYLEFWAPERQRFAFGPMETAFLSHLVHRLGEERFRAFWTSAKPVEEAIRDASGRPMGSNVLAWAEDAYGEQRRGPGLSAGATGSALVLGVLALALAIRAARRREAR